METDTATSLADQSTVADLEEGEAASLAGQPKLADMEREADKAARVQVLLRLIQLACMMVSSYLWQEISLTYSIYVYITDKTRGQYFIHLCKCSPKAISNNSSRCSSNLQ